MELKFIDGASQTFFPLCILNDEACAVIWEQRQAVGLVISALLLTEEN